MPRCRGETLIIFCAPERFWIQKAEEARAEELSWRVKNYLNDSLITLVWQVDSWQVLSDAQVRDVDDTLSRLMTPNMIVFLSFLSYTKFAGRTLTIPVAFTALALFEKINWPLQRLPHFIMEYLECEAALNFPSLHELG